jgi:hypothetical protein
MSPGREPRRRPVHDVKGKPALDFGQSDKENLHYRV